MAKKLQVVPAEPSPTKLLMARLRESEPAAAENAPGVGEVAIASMARDDLRTMLVPEDWERIRHFGRLDVYGDPNTASLNCTNAIMVIGRALQLDRLRRYPLELNRGQLLYMLEKEHEIRGKLRALARAGRRAVPASQEARSAERDRDAGKVQVAA